MRQREKIALSALVAAGVLVVAGLAFYLRGNEGGEVAEAPHGGEKALSAAAGLEGGKTPDVGGDIEEEGVPLEKVAVDSGALGTGKNAEGEPAGGRGVITGRVVAEDAGGLAGARVVFRTRPNSPFFFDVEDAASGEGKGKSGRFAAETGPNGSFRLENLPPAGEGFLVVSSENFVTRNVSLGRYDGGEKDVGSLVLELGGTVTGTVLSSADRSPVPGAVVSARKSDSSSGLGGVIFFRGPGPGNSVSTRSAPDGSFVLRGVPAGEVTVSARHEDNPPSKKKKVRVAKGRTVTGVNLELEPGRSISGVVTDTTGAPLPGIDVRTSLKVNLDAGDLVGVTSLVKRTKTGPDGSFTIKGLSGGNYTLKASGGVYLARSLAGVAAGTRDARIVLEKGGMILGHVFDGRTGEPLKTFDLAVRRQKFGRSFPGRVLKGDEAARAAGKPGFDGRGAFLVEGVGEEDPLRFDFSAPGCAGVTIGGVKTAPGSRCEKDFTLPPEARVSGILESPEGEPLKGGTLTLKRRKPPSRSFDFSGGKGIRSKRAGFDSGGGGRSFSDFAGKVSWRSVSAADGTFSFRGVPEGDFTLEAAHDDYPAPDPLPLTLAEGEEKTDVTIRMPAGGAVTGTVFGEDGRPLAGAGVRARRVRNGTGSPERGEFFPDGRFSTTADIDGVYLFKGLEPGVYSIGLEGRSEGPFSMVVFFSGMEAKRGASGTVMVKEGETARLDLYDLPPGTITGFVTEAGKPVEGMKVRLFPAEGFAFMPLSTAVTGDQGSYTLSGLDPGAYEVRLAVGGLADPVAEKADVEAGAVVQRDFELPTGRVTGRIADGATGDPLKGVTVRLERVVSGGERTTKKVQQVGVTMISSFGDSEEGESVSTFTLGGSGGRVATDVEGRFEIRYIEEGTYRLVAEKDGYIRGTVEKVTVRGGRETARQNLSLFRGSDIRGKAVNLDDGRPAAFQAVRCERLGGDGKPVSDGAQTAMTDGNGAFIFKGLENGTYRLSSPGSGEGDTVVEVRPGKDAEGVVLRVRRGS